MTSSGKYGKKGGPGKNNKGYDDGMRRQQGRFICHRCGQPGRYAKHYSQPHVGAGGELTLEAQDVGWRDHMRNGEGPRCIKLIRIFTSDPIVHDDVEGYSRSHNHGGGRRRGGFVVAWGRWCQRWRVTH